jgi:hypothetical protein
VRRALEGEGEQPEVLAHVATCAACRAYADMLRLLADLEPAAPDAEAVDAILTSLPAAPWQRRRPATWLPLAAGLGLVVAGLGLVGGLPASGAVAAVPGAAGNLFGYLAAWFLDALAVVRDTSHALGIAVVVEGVGLLLWLAVVAVGSGWAAVALARAPRRRPRS